MRIRQRRWRLLGGIVAVSLADLGSTRAQSPPIDELKGKIFDARMAQQSFANGLRFCNELDGRNFYYGPRNRVLNLDEYHRSLENLAKAQAYNPERHRPWNEQDAAARWEEAKQQALDDKKKCELAASLPQLERQLEELQKQAGAMKKD